MHFSPVLLVASLAGLSSAAGLVDALPKCALQCMLDVANKDVIPCKPADLECLCEEKNYKTLYSESSACVLKSCGNKVAVEEVLPAAQKLCDSVKEGSSSSKQDKADNAESTTTSQKPSSSSAEETGQTATETATETTTSSAIESATETPGMAAHATGFAAAPLVAMVMAALL